MTERSLNGPKKVAVVCPLCQRSGAIQVPDTVFHEDKGLSSLLIRSGVTCTHSFQVFIDKNYKVRGYQMMDYEIAPEATEEGGQQVAEAQPTRTNGSPPSGGEGPRAPDPKVIAAIQDFMNKIDDLVSGSLCALALGELCNSIQARIGFHPVLPDMRNWINQLQYGATWDNKTRDIMKKKVLGWVEKLAEKERVAHQSATSN